jgi:hypothetical protein
MQSNQYEEQILLRLLSPILHRASSAINAPLQIELRDADIVASAIRAEDVRRVLADFADPSAVCRILDGMLENLVDVDRSQAPQFVGPETTLSNQSEGPETSPRVEELTDRLAAWLLRLRTMLATVHPKAMEIVCLRLEGYRSRDIAERLDLGLRLSKRISRDMVAALRAAPAEG